MNSPRTSAQFTAREAVDDSIDASWSGTRIPPAFDPVKSRNLKGP